MLSYDWQKRPLFPRIENNNKWFIRKKIKSFDVYNAFSELKDRYNFISVKAKRIGSIGIINYDMRYVPNSGLSQKVDLSISETLLDCIINNVIVNWYNRAGIPRNGLRLKEVSTT